MEQKLTNNQKNPVWEKGEEETLGTGVWVNQHGAS